MKWLLLLALVSGAVGFVSVRTAISQQQRKKVEQKVDNEEPTVIREGIMTELERTHSKLYKQGKAGRNLVDRSLKDGGVEMILLPPWTSPPDDLNTISYDQYLIKMSCRADAVVIGTVSRKSSQLTEDKDFVFTDYNLLIEDVFKKDPSLQISSHSQIVITRPGGKVLINGQIISVKDKLAEPLEVGGRYVLFLNFIPSTNSYKTLRGDGVYLLKEGQVFEPLNVQTSELKNPQKQEAAFIENIKSAAASTCK
jgi:hypothetical protein